MYLEELIGKFILVYYVGGDVKYPTTLTVESINHIEGKVFVSGFQPKNIMGAYNWLSQVETHIAWDNVTQFHVFDDYKAFQKAGSQTKRGFFGRIKD